MKDQPFRQAHGNILVGRRRHRAVYRLGTVSYPNLPVDQKFGWRTRLGALAFDMQADFTIARVWRGYPADGYVRQALELADRRHADIGALTRYLEGHRPALERPGNHRPEVYLLVDLPTPPLPFAAQAREDFDAARDLVERVAGVDRPRPVASQLLEALVASEEDALAKVTGWASARRATTRELVWMCRRTQYRGLIEPEGDLWAPRALEVVGADGELDFVPDAVAYERLWPSDVREVGGVLEVQTDHGVVYQQVLAIGDHERKFPGDELLFAPLELVGHPVDSFSVVRWRDNASVHATLKKRLRNNSEMLDAQQAAAHGVQSLRPERAIERAILLEDELGASDAPPMLQPFTLLALAGWSRKELDQHVKALNLRFPRVKLWPRVGDQVAMWQNTLPRAKAGRGGAMYREWSRTDDFAAMMPTATHSLGSERGVYWMRVGGRPQFLNLRQAAEEDRAAAWLFAGTTGSGKSSAAMLVEIDAALLGSEVVDIDPDPKPGHRWEEIPEIMGLRGGYTAIDLDDLDAHAGMLDPLVIVRPSRSTDIAHSYLMTMLPGEGARTSAAVRNAIIDTKQQDAQPCCLAVVDRLMKPGAGEDANAAGEVLASWARDGLARFGFSNGTHKRVDRAQFTTLRLAALSLPPAEVDRVEWEPIQELSVATLGLVTEYSVDVVDSDRSRHKVISLDEAHFVLGNRKGQAHVGGLTRQIRKKNGVLLLESQYVSDPGKTRNLMGTLVMFGFEQYAEARDAVELLGLDPEDAELVESVKAQRKGACIVRDFDGHVARGQVDAVYPELIKSLGARPPVQESMSEVA